MLQNGHKKKPNNELWLMLLISNLNGMNMSTKTTWAIWLQSPEPQFSRKSFLLNTSSISVSSEWKHGIDSSSMKPIMLACKPLNKKYKIHRDLLEIAIYVYKNSPSLETEEGKRRFEIDVQRFLSLYPGAVVKEGYFIIFNQFREAFDFQRFYALDAIHNNRDLSRFDT